MKLSKSILCFLVVASVMSCKDPQPLEGSREYKILEIYEQMKSSPEWMALLNEKALQQNLPLDTIMYRDAIWVIDQNAASNNASDTVK
jgi:hypothetical protein